MAANSNLKIEKPSISRRTAWILTAALFFIGCRPRASGDEAAGTLFTSAKASLEAGYTLFQSSHPDMIGLSGLAIDPAGTLWTVPEAKRLLISIVREGVSFRLSRQPFPIVGVDEGLDLESIAALGDSQFVVGSEAAGRRSSDKIFWLKLENGYARVTKAVTLEYRLWKIQGEDNKGVEGLCFADNQLVVAAEPVFRSKGRRYAPIARYEIASAKWYAAQLPLTTEAGKISGLYCRAARDGELSVRAIERHYGIARVLSFVLPIDVDQSAGRAAMTLSPRVDLDLARIIRPLHNFEGIAEREKELFLISDNHQSVTIGPTHLLRYSPYRRTRSPDVGKPY
ncbi:MAG: esterase-like activity of phytase family protein [Deltaproteobacteria bacterium]|nr:esterase-like activity of phytase family protein [Deltaproteobacteria bacterium]